MTKRKTPVPLPLMTAERMFASWEAIAWRSWLMVEGSCSGEEYGRMFLEKVQAANETAAALALPWTAATATAFLAPWHQRATANARRLRNRKQ